VVLFKASTQNQKTNLSKGADLHKKTLTENADLVEKMTNLSATVGAESLLNILKNYARVSTDSKVKQCITVGIVGFPNVGKSSIINSLKRTRSAATGNQPGVTKKMQEIQLDKNIVLLDSPGVVMGTSENTNSLILRQAIKIEDLADPIKPVEAILDRVEQEEILKLYKIAKYTSVETMLGQISRKKGLLRAGGVANMDEAARSVLRDYQNGKIKYFSVPPGGEQCDDSEEDVDVEMQE